ncbi:MAG: glycosyltransferase family 4 protein [Halobacteriota archaeon]
MASSPIRILFLIHSASRNGATILLLHFIQWLKTQVDWEIEVLVNGRGPLLDEFRSISKTMVLRSPASFLSVFPRNWQSGLQRHLETQYLRVLLSGRRFDLIYANTSATWPLVGTLAQRAPALLWHIHELGYGLRLSIGEDRVNQVFQVATRFVAVSNSVQNMLVHEFNVPYENVDLVHGFVPFPSLTAEEQRSRRQRIRKKLGWPEDAFVVGGCGTLDWRKGTDLFLQIAYAISQAKGYERVRFLWVGGGIRDKEDLEFAHDVSALCLEERCSRIPATAEVYDFYCAMDVFALTSREDPFPLVMLEAGAHGVPVVCFAGSGGGPEFTSEDAGLIAPYLDITKFAAHIMTLHDIPDLRERLGVAASTKVLTHHGIETQGPKLLLSIERCLSGGRESTSFKLRP